MKRLVDDWSLDDPHPEAYRQVLDNISSTRGLAESVANHGIPTECEPQRVIQIAIEVGAMGPQVRAAMVDLRKLGRVDVLLDLVENAASAEAVAPVWDFLVAERTLESLLDQPRVDIPLVGRLARRHGVSAAPTLLSAALIVRRCQSPCAVLRAPAIVRRRSGNDIRGSASRRDSGGAARAPRAAWTSERIAVWLLSPGLSRQWRPSGAARSGKTVAARRGGARGGHCERVRGRRRQSRVRWPHCRSGKVSSRGH